MFPPAARLAWSAYLSVLGLTVFGHSQFLPVLCFPEWQKSGFKSTLKKTNGWCHRGFVQLFLECIEWTSYQKECCFLRFFLSNSQIATFSPTSMYFTVECSSHLSVITVITVNLTFATSLGSYCCSFCCNNCNISSKLHFIFQTNQWKENYWSFDCYLKHEVNCLLQVKCAPIRFVLFFFLIS